MSTNLEIKLHLFKKENNSVPKNKSESQDLASLKTRKRERKYVTHYSSFNY